MFPQQTQYLDFKVHKNGAIKRVWQVMQLVPDSGGGSNVDDDKVWEREKIHPKKNETCLSHVVVNVYIMPVDNST
jgi:hypothetical protein